MPFGPKPGTDGQLLDFNRVYAEYIAPALEAAEMTVFRADQEERVGDIRTDMFQELLVADLVVADLGIDNPNFRYELGVRHALRARGVVLVSGERVTTAYDLYTDRKAALRRQERRARSGRTRGRQAPAHRHGQRDSGVLARPQGEPCTT